MGKLEFTEAEIRKTQRSLDATGVALPNFKGVSSAVSGQPEVVEEPKEREENRIARLIQAHDKEITLLQAHSRGALVRWRLSYELQTLEDYESALINLQACARGHLIRLQYFANAVTYKQINDWCTLLQSRCRGYLARSSRSLRQSHLTLTTQRALTLQAAANGHLQRKRLRAFHAKLAANEAVFIKLQAKAIGTLIRKRQRSTRSTMASHSDAITNVQALARGRLARRRFDEITADLELSSDDYTGLQAYIRGHLCRKALLRRTALLEDYALAITQIQSAGRGVLMRQKCCKLRAALACESGPVVECQAAARGCLARLIYNDVLIRLAEAEYDIVEVQASARGALQRLRYRARLRHYKQNMDRVVKVQSFIRARQQGAAYQSLTMDENPPVSTIKNFIHLLNDSSVDFEEEIAMEDVRKQIVQSVRQNEAAEEHIEQMDIKIALLVKQAIKIDEVIQHQRRMDRGLTFPAGNVNPFDLKAMNKHARNQLENYQKFFYIIQTQPIYLARLFGCLQESSISDAELKAVENFVMVLFGYAQKKREEYFLLKLIRTSIIKEVSLCRGVQDFLAGSYLWSRILANHTKSSKDNRFLRDLLGSTVELIVHNDALDLESNPTVIYQAITADEESRSGQASGRPADISCEYAIQDPETRMTFIKRLRDLRDLTEKLVDSLEVEVHKLPYGIRYIAREAYRAMEEHLVDEPEEYLNQIIGNFICQRYICPALVNPDQNGIINTGVSPTRRKNLAEVSKIFSQISMGKRFDEGSYLQPLNEFMDQAARRMMYVLRTIVQVPDAETHYGITELDDVIATKRPILYIKASDIFSIHSTIFRDLSEVAPEPEDPLNAIMQALGPPPGRAEDMMLMSLSNSEIAVTLDPKAIDVDDPEADERSLFMQTKRCLLYIIRIQAGQSLIDILVEPVTEDDEHRWHEILREERQQKVSSQAQYSPAQPDMSTLSYAELKRQCLENIVHLEHLGWITRDNGYQELLNRVADDIKTQNRRRIERQIELHSARITLQDLTEKRTYLDAQLQSYNDYIEQAMMALQSKKSKKKSILPFTKQYFHMRDLQRAGKVPQFGSRKYSAAKLYQKGVLVSIANEIPPFDRIDMTISSDRIGAFSISSTYQNQYIPNASRQVNLDDLLQAQYNKSEIIDLFDGQVKFRVNLLLNLLFKHFFS